MGKSRAGTRFPGAPGHSITPPSLSSSNCTPLGSNPLLWEKNNTKYWIFEIPRQKLTYFLSLNFKGFMMLCHSNDMWILWIVSHSLGCHMFNTLHKPPRNKCQSCLFCSFIHFSFHTHKVCVRCRAHLFLTFKENIWGVGREFIWSPSILHFSIKVFCTERAHLCWDMSRHSSLDLTRP